VRTTLLDPAPLTQSAELQTRRSPRATTTDTNLAPMLKRHGWLWLARARTVNWGLVPDWYQYCCDERLSVTPPLVQASALPEEWDRPVSRCRAGVGSGRGEGDGSGRSLWLLTRGGAEFAAPVAPGGPAWPADELATSRPFTAQLRVVTSPMATPTTITRRRQ
jgi:hypothetical protein